MIKSNLKALAAWLLLIFSASDVAEAQNRTLVSSTRNLLGTNLNRTATVVTADFDEDGDLDIAVANGRHWPQQNCIFLNQGRARFHLARPLSPDLSTTYACQPADFNGDGHLDLAVGNDMAPCKIMLGDGTGKFQEGEQFGQPSSVRSLTCVDIDGDDDVDILATCRGMPNLVYLNDGKAHFAEVRPFGAQRDSTIDVAASDINEDGILDLVLANRDGQRCSLLFGLGKGRFSEATTFGSGSGSARAVATGDFNGDGHIDWVVGNIDSANIVYFGDGKGGQYGTLTVGPADSVTYALAIADVDNDMQLDIVVGNREQQNSVYFNRDKGARFEVVHFGETDAMTYGLCVGDFTGDGYVDVAVANSDGLNRIFINRPIN